MLHVFLNNPPHIIDIIINPTFADLQTKGRFACPVCGPKMKSRWSKSLGKEVFDEYRHFLSKNHKYRTTEKISFQWEIRDWTKTTKNDTSPMEVVI